MGAQAIACLRALTATGRYGLDLWRELQQRGFGPLTAASVYERLHRLEADGLVRSRWCAKVDGSRWGTRRYYWLTVAGQRYLDAICGIENPYDGLIPGDWWDGMPLD